MLKQPVVAQPLSVGLREFLEKYSQPCWEDGNQTSHGSESSKYGHWIGFTTQKTALFLMTFLVESQAIINDSNKSQDPFHAQNKLSFSSSWLSKVSSFRQETYRIHYRNDPVKYNLTPLLKCSNLRNIWFAYHTVIWLNHTISYTMAVSSFWARSEKGQTMRKSRKAGEVSTYSYLTVV